MYRDGSNNQVSRLGRSRPLFHPAADGLFSSTGGRRHGALQEQCGPARQSRSQRSPRARLYSFYLAGLISDGERLPAHRDALPNNAPSPIRLRGFSPCRRRDSAHSLDSFSSHRRIARPATTRVANFVPLIAAQSASLVSRDSSYAFFRAPSDVDSCRRSSFDASSDCIRGAGGESRRPSEAR